MRALVTAFGFSRMGCCMANGDGLVKGCGLRCLKAGCESAILPANSIFSVAVVLSGSKLTNSFNRGLYK